MGNRKSTTVLGACTPGPWHVRAGMQGVQIANTQGICVARTPCLDRQAQADGALIAAAPELLASLRELIGIADVTPLADFEREIIARAEDVVAKAEGR